MEKANQKKKLRKEMIREKNYYINALPSEWILKSKHIYSR